MPKRLIIPFLTMSRRTSLGERDFRGTRYAEDTVVLFKTAIHLKIISRMAFGNDFAAFLNSIFI